MSDRASPDLPPPERSGETLWVVDVTAPLAPGRVRWVAAEAAARLQLPAEKLVALLENRIGPVTKPLPKASADRVAEVLDLAGAEVAIRAAGSADSGRASEDVREPTESASSEAVSRDASGASEASSEGTHIPVPAPVPAPDAAPASRRDSGPHAENASENASEGVSAGVSESAPASVPESAAGFPTARRTDRSTDPPMDPPTEPATERPGSVDADAPSERDVEPHAHLAAADSPGRSATVAGQETDATMTPGTDEQTAAPDATAAADEGGAQSKPASADPGALPPVGRPGATRRDDDRRDDPWQSLGDDDDEAMLGTWTHRSDSAPVDSPRKAPPTGTPAADAGSGAAGRASRRSAPPAAAPGGGPAGSVAPAFDPNEPPHVIRDRDEADDEADDEEDGWTYGLRDPFAEAERQERATRRWALAVALLVALGIFLVLQWAYSRPGLGDRTPPAYDVGLTAYREGAFVSAARAWTPRAEAGDVDAMFMLGWMAEYGQGRPWSNREAAGWYDQAAKRGHAPSQLRLADLYAQGLGVAFDPDVATRWYLAAAESGLPRAQREAALAMARDGRHAEAAAWLGRAAAARDPDAAAWLALMEATRTLNPRSE